MLPDGGGLGPKANFILGLSGFYERVGRLEDKFQTPSNNRRDTQYIINSIDTSRFDVEMKRFGLDPGDYNLFIKEID